MAEHETHARGQFSGDVRFDEALASNIITLSYHDQEQPARNISVKIAPDLGNNMFSLRVGEHELIYCDVEQLKRMSFTGNFVLWPFPNRVRDKRYTYQGKQYSLQSVVRIPGQEDDPLIHGLVMDRQWQFEQPVAGKDSVSVRTFVEVTPESPYFETYPFESRLTLTFTLSAQGVTVAYEVHNIGTRDLPYGFALHPYFKGLSGFEDTLITLPARQVMEADAELLPTGRLLTLDGIMYAMFDLRQPVPLGHLKLDHVYTAIPAHASSAVTFSQQNLRVRLEASKEFTHIVIYTSSDASNPFVCIENQTCATDAINLHGQEGLTEMAHLLELHPGEVGTGSITYLIEQQ